MRLKEIKLEIMESDKMDKFFEKHPEASKFLKDQEMFEQHQKKIKRRRGIELPSYMLGPVNQKVIKMHFKYIITK